MRVKGVKGCFDNSCIGKEVGGEAGDWKKSLASKNERMRESLFVGVGLEDCPASLAIIVGALVGDTGPCPLK